VAKARWRGSELLLGLALGIGLSFSHSAASTREWSAGRPAELLDDVLSTIRSRYVEPVPDTDLYLSAAKGVVDRLRDPYSTLLPRNEYQSAKESLEGTYSGAGIKLDFREGAMTVVQVASGSPAHWAGMEPGDRLLSVDDQSTAAWSVERATAALQGKEDSIVQLLIIRPGEGQPRVLALKRARLHRSALGPAFLLDTAVGYIPLKTISKGSAAELSSEVAKLMAAGMHSLVLDLRSNRGGLITEAVAVAELFLDPPVVIATVRGRNMRKDESYRAQKAQSWPDLGLAVLVDRHTASAAELIAAALQDHARAVVVGTASFGKGVVQTTLPIGKDHALTLTTARWYTPSGRSVQRASGRVGQVRVTPAGSERTRPLLPAHGITPDLPAAAPERSESELAFITMTKLHRKAYEEAVEEIAVRLLGTGPVLDESFVVTPRMRAMLLQRLQGSGMPITSEGFSRASAVVDQDLGEALMRRAFGEQRARRWQFGRDPAVSAAVSWVRGSSEPGEDLLTTPISTRGIHSR
jgi:carboxyl-terminal processing protease